MLNMTELAGILRANGSKVTPQRLAIYDMLAHTKEHPTAEAIYNELRPKYPAMSLATVYKSVDILSRLKVIQTLNLGEESFRYDANMEIHPHVQCLECGKVLDVLPLDLSSVSEKIAEETGFAIQEEQLFLYGVCPHCQKKKKH